MRLSMVLLFGCLASVTAPLTAQEAQADRSGDPAKFRVGFFGFGARAGIDFKDDNQVVFGYTLDLGDLYTDRLRMRAVGEVGLGSAGDTYVLGGEFTYRFVPDATLAVPYMGGGLALYSQEGCGELADCPALWLQFALGFEISIREPMRWFVEFHAEDSLSRHRLLVGLTTRRGG